MINPIRDVSYIYYTFKDALLLPGVPYLEIKIESQDLDSYLELKIH